MKMNRYLNYWPKERHRDIVAMIKDIKIWDNPEHSFDSEDRLSNVLLIGENINSKQLLGLLGKGFKHIVQEKRDDFSFSFLSTALIMNDPLSFIKKPFPFLFRSYGDGLSEVPIQELALQWNFDGNKKDLLKKVLDFFSANKKINPYHQNIQILVEEMISNSHDKSNPTSKCIVYLAYSEDRFCVASRDLKKTFPLPKIRERLTELSNQDQFHVQRGDQGAGLGLAMMINLCSNFYLCHKVGSGTLAVALVDLRKGLKELETRPKNVHLMLIE